MLTIPNAVEEVIKKKPFLEGALVEGLINLSALARQLKPEIEKKVGKEVNDSAVIMALNRLVPRLELMSAMKFKKVVENIGDIIVRSNFGRLCLREFSHAVREAGHAAGPRAHDEGRILYLFTGDIRDDVSSAVRSSGWSTRFSPMRTISPKRSICRPLPSNCPPRIRSVQGVYYYIFKELAWDNINITEVISTTNEFTVVISDSDIHRAFTILMEAKRQVSI